MATRTKNWTDGEALTTIELQRSASIGAQADDAALAALLTPGSAQKRIVPLSEETASVNPRLLAIPSPTTGAVRVQPALFVAGGVALPNNIAASCRQETALDTALIASNGGATRYDLVYATLRFATSVTGSRKVKDVGTGVVSTKTPPLEVAPQVTMTVLPNVGNVTPLATMPADSTDSTLSAYQPYGVYNFPIALITVANGYTAGSAIAQSTIAPLWVGGWVQPHRVRGLRVMSINAGAAAEKASVSLTDRLGALQQFMTPFKFLPSTSTSPSGGPVLDASIDWRRRIIWGTCAWLNSATQAPLEGNVTMLPTQGSGYGVIQPMYTGDGGSFGALVYNSGATTVGLTIDASSGNLRLYRTGNPSDNTNGDLMLLTLSASDRLVVGN